jgi:hypothetical protein
LALQISHGGARNTALPEGFVDESAALGNGSIAMQGPESVRFKMKNESSVSSLLDKI